MNEKTRIELLMMFVKPVWFKLVFYVVLQLVSVGIKFVLVPLFLTQISKFLGNETVLFPPAVLVAIFFALQIWSALNNTIFSTLNLEIEKLWNGLFTTLIYQKNFKLSYQSQAAFSSGYVINLINQDVYGLACSLNTLVEFLTLPISIITGIIYLGLLIGVSVWVSVGLVVVTLIITILSGPSMETIFDKEIKETDSRITKMRELIHGIFNIKVNALELFYRFKVQDIRDREIVYLRQGFIIALLCQTIASMTSVLMPLASFSVYSALGNQLTPATIVTALYLLQNLSNPMVSCNYLVQNWIYIRKRWDRIATFLLATELVRVIDSDDGEFAIDVQDAIFKYPSKETVLEEAFEKSPFKVVVKSLQIPKNSMVAVVGPIGSGKTSLIHSLVGGLELETGTMKRNGTISFSSQQPWIKSGSIVDIITMGATIDQERLNQVIHVACLETDVNDMQHGVYTQIGEGGVNLSGGQQARLTLARALYKNSDIYFFDSPFSALDVSVAQTVFQRIRVFLKEKCVVISTHKAEYLHLFDYIAVMDQGRLTDYGRFDDLVQSSVLGKGNELKEQSEIESKPIMTTDQETRTEFEEKEDRRQGSVSFSVYKDYIKCFQPSQLILALGFFVTAIACEVWYNLWIAQASTPQNQISVSQFITMSGISSGIAVFAKTILVASIPFMVIRASCKLHDDALGSIFAAPITFFQQNPAGRILNRFTSDVASTDTQMTNVFFVLCILLHSFFVQFALIVAVNGYIVFWLCFVFGCFYVIFRWFQPSNRELKRLQSLLKSPLDSHITQSLHGRFIIQTFQAEEIFASELDELFDQYQTVRYLKDGLSIWVNLRLELLSSLISLFVMVLAIWNQSNAGSVAFVALAVSASTGIATNMYELLIWLGNGEAEMNSVERLLHYGNNLPKEALRVVEKENRGWPSGGDIEFEKVSLCYPTVEEPVLANLNLHIKSGEHVAIVGRTGAGKSTILTALLRLIEVSKGTIKVDGIDISKLGLETLRTSLLMIPQTPVFFQGTARENLDPLGEFEDQLLWSALTQIGLEEFISSNGGLDFVLTENGKNLSVGQRQLLCIAIAIIKNPQILLMDEVTSSMDRKTEIKIQELLKSEFRKTTVICIAHRLHSIMNFEKVFVMDKGQVIESGAPFELLGRQGVFSDMCLAAGITSTES